MIEFSSLRDMSAGLANRDFSSVELTQDHLTRIQTADSDINSFVTVNPELALAKPRGRISGERLAINSRRWGCHSPTKTFSAPTES